jgi:hypothetical protein
MSESPARCEAYLTATVVALFQPWLELLLNVSLWGLWIRLGYRSA